MFREFNEQLNDVELIGGADNLLEGTDVTKVVVGGDSTLSSLNSTFKDCVELDRIEGELDLNGVTSIDNMLEGTNLVKSINIKNANIDDLTSDNAFPYIEGITVGGECTKGGIQQVLKGATWQLDNISYTREIEDKVSLKSVESLDTDNLVLLDTLEQRAKNIEILGQTYENLIEGEGEYKLTDPRSVTWTESNDSFTDLPSIVEVSEIYGNTVQDTNDLNNIQSVGDLDVDEEGNEQYKLELDIKGKNLCPVSTFEPIKWTGSALNHKVCDLKLKSNTTYTISRKIAHSSNELRVRVYSNDSLLTDIGANSSLKFTTKEVTTAWLCCYTFNDNYYIVEELMIEEGESQTDFEPYVENKTTVLMPQPLRKVGNFADKLYWDNNKNKFLMDSNTKIYPPSGTTNYVIVAESDDFVTLSMHKNYITGVRSEGAFCNLLPQIQSYNATEEGFLYVDPYFYFTVSKSNLDSSISDYRLALKTWLHGNNAEFLCPGKTETAETEILEPTTIETYSSKTHILVNSDVQPSQMTLTNQKTLIDIKELNTDTDYTMQFNCTKKGNKPITVNLCGTEKEVDVPVGVNHISITTPSSLVNSRLELGGDGNVVSDIMLFEGEINQYPNYFDSVQSVGNLQGDNYEIGISTNEGFSVTITSSNPLAKGDKLYWSLTNKRYEIDRNGVIEVPTVTGDVIDLPRLYQKEATTLSTSTGIIKPGKLKIEYNDFE